MPDEERYIEALCKAVNLTKYEASIYVALLKHGGWMTARQASFLSRVPRAKTYGALRKLVGLQLAEQAPTSPTLYRGGIAKQMLTPIMEEMKNMLRVLNEFAAGSYPQKTEGYASSAWTFEPNEIRKSLPTMIRSAQAQIDISATAQGAADIYNRYCKDLEKAVKKKVKIKIFTHSKADRLIENELKHLFQVKRTACNIDADCYLFDGAKLLIVAREKALLVTESLLIKLFKETIAQLESGRASAQRLTGGFSRRV